ncbi:laminin subunit alpha-3-like [Acipenser ruthenus]|uniref:laminin subunit alpha-3-like n=1 Tax=Acipenser ruthenus TaxID=7906 RepID=UPI0027424971|nr:laminin subunit alpha-3-like [Acipenser ruthenus]
MWGDTFWLRNMRWLAVWLVVVGHCLGQKQQQRLSFSHLDDIASHSGNKKCAPGYYRDNKGLYLGRCVPCFCNGHSNTCEDGSGKCLNCLWNTVGDNCEHCKDGYYGNATQGTCQVCPCPLAIPYNSFATGCKEVGGNFECLCKPGYTGSKCQRCATGYYGDPRALNGKCSPCNCGNNGNPGNCDPLTGGE